MKKSLIILILFAIGFPSFLVAQRFNGGVTAGMVGSQVMGDTYAGFHKFGLAGGAFVNLNLSKSSTLQMELLLIQKGSRRNPQKDENPPVFYLQRTNYIELPLLYQYRLGKKFEMELGPAFDVLISSYEEVNDLGEIKNVSPFQPLTYNIVAGISYYIADVLKVNFRTNNSILSIRDKEVNGHRWRFFDYGQYNDCLVLSLYFLIRKPEN
ncbi:MAG: PorT family protein [Bacteroidetes bacterium]|nr:PorT family protein [Bacteroidota bacterium]